MKKRRHNKILCQSWTRRKLMHMAFNPKQFHKKILELAEINLFSVETIYKKTPVPIIALKKKASIENAPYVYISAGIHGDEPAGPWVIEKLLRESFFNDQINWQLIPMLNPTGLELGTRENADGVDLNRDYKAGTTKEVAAHLKWLKKQSGLDYDLMITLHEDWESPGFYCYTIIPKGRGQILVDIFEAVKNISPINLSEEIEGAKARGGFIIHDLETFDKVLNDWQNWPEAFFLIKNNPGTLHFTFETASEQPLQQRINTHCAAIEAVIQEIT